MRNLLIITREVNEEDDLLGFFIEWIKEFAKHFDRVFIIALAEGKYHLPENVSVYSLGKEKGNSKVAMAFNFYKYLFKLAPRSNGIFAHTSARYVIASWPLALIFRKKIILWYLHRSIDTKLKIAEKLCYKIVTADKESLALESKKIIETGHGISVDRFKTDRNWTDEAVKILSVGRISKIKDYETLLYAAQILKENKINFKIEIIGRPIMPPDFSYFESLKSLNEKLGLSDVVQFTGFVPHNYIADYYKKSDIVIGLTPKGGLDKTILEGMASGCLILTSNEVNRKYLTSDSQMSDYIPIFGHKNAKDLAEKIIGLSKLSPEIKKGISDFMVESVAKHHSLGKLINQIASLI